MNCIIFSIFFLFGTIAVYLLTKSLYSLLYLLLIRLNGIKTKGFITGYDEKTYYTKRTPSRLVRLYYPVIKYEINNKSAFSKTTNGFNKNSKNYSINDEIAIYYNKKKENQIVIKGDCNYFQYILVLGLGILYLFLMCFICSKILVTDGIFNIVNIVVALISVIMFLLVRLIFFSLYGYINEEKINKYCVQNSVIYMIVMFLSLVYFMII